MEKALPTFTTVRLELRPASLEDVDALFAFEQRFYAFPGAARFFTRGESASLDEIRARLVRTIGPFSIERTIYSWFARFKGEDAIVGCVSLVRWNHEHHVSEVGYMVDPAHWGEGLACEALAPMVDHALAELGLHRAEAHVDPENLASVRTAEKLGFVLEGTLRENTLMRGRYCDTAMYAKLAPR